jgi:hypothetical protein
MRTINWKVKGSKEYDCTIKVLDKQKLIIWIDCTCWDFMNRRLKSIGENADKKIFAEPCKHLKRIVDALIKLGYKLKKQELTGPSKLTASVIRAVVERSNGKCEVESCPNKATQFHRIVRGSNGGKYTLENTKHICKYHHKSIHQNEFPSNK